MTDDLMADFKVCPHCNYSTGKEVSTNTFPCGSYMDNGLFYGSELCKTGQSKLAAEAYCRERDALIRSIVAATFPNKDPREFKDYDVVAEIQRLHRNQVPDQAHACTVLDAEEAEFQVRQLDAQRRFPAP